MKTFRSAKKQRRSADSLVAFVQQYCAGHYAQVCVAAFNREMANRAQAGGSLSRRGVAVVPPLYNFFITVTAGQTLELFDEMADRKRRLSPLGSIAISQMAADIVAGTLPVDAVDAAGIVQGVMEQAPELAQAAAAAKGENDEEFRTNIARMDRQSARIVLIFCAAEKTADLLFEAWQKNPSSPPVVDIETASEYADLVGAHIQDDTPVHGAVQFAEQLPRQTPHLQPVDVPAWPAATNPSINPVATQATNQATSPDQSPNPAPEPDSAPVAAQVQPQVQAQVQAPEPAAEPGVWPNLRLAG